MTEGAVVVGRRGRPSASGLEAREETVVRRATSIISAEQLGTVAIKGAMEKTGTDPSSVEHVVMGHALQTSGQAIFGAGHAGLRPGKSRCSADRLCGSGAHSKSAQPR